MTSVDYQRIYDVVKRIPEGRVATYGQVALLAGLPGQARRVGYALHALPDESPVPWHRVINAKGEISILPDPFFGDVQRMLLESEGVIPDSNGKYALSRYQWKPEHR